MATQRSNATTAAEPLELAQRSMSKGHVNGSGNGNHKKGNGHNGNIVVHEKKTKASTPTPTITGAESSFTDVAGSSPSHFAPDHSGGAGIADAVVEGIGVVAYGVGAASEVYKVVHAFDDFKHARNPDMKIKNGIEIGMGGLLVAAKGGECIAHVGHLAHATSAATNAVAVAAAGPIAVVDGVRYCISGGMTWSDCNQELEQKRAELVTLTGNTGTGAGAADGDGAITTIKKRRTNAKFDTGIGVTKIVSGGLLIGACIVTAPVAVVALKVVGTAGLVTSAVVGVRHWFGFG